MIVALTVRPYKAAGRSTEKGHSVLGTQRRLGKAWCRGDTGQSWSLEEEPERVWQLQCRMLVRRVAGSENQTKCQVTEDLSCGHVHLSGFKVGDDRIWVSAYLQRR